MVQISKMVRANMTRKMMQNLLETFGQKYSTMLRINLISKSNGEIFKWFLVSIMFGAPIAETSVIKTYKCFETHKVLTPQKIINTGWSGLVSILDEGSYTRYDFKTSDKLLDVTSNLLKNYDGNLNLLHEQASNPDNLEKSLKSLGKGIGDITVSIFLRELRGVWEKADPKPTPLVILSAKNLGIITEEDPARALRELKEFWGKNKISGRDYIDFETALLRLGKDFCRKGKCGRCPLHKYCTR